MIIKRIRILMFLVVVLSSCDSMVTSNDDNDNGEVEVKKTYTLVNAFPEYVFDKPIDLQNSGDSTGRLFVVEHKGVVKVVAFSGIKEFLNIEDKVFFDNEEQGVLGLAFHPNYKENGYFYLNYMMDEPLRNVISRWQVSDNPDKANPDSEVVLLVIEQPGHAHNGGQLAFGLDGYLYISLGDGGHGFSDNAQDLSNLFGSILRIDVDNLDSAMKYSIPSSNPFFGNTSGYMEEIYAYGLRNPWRMSFDSETGELWTGDVGEGSFEEVNVIIKGANYGWPIVEGFICLPMDCSTENLEFPIFVYDHGEGASITGGMVYRGDKFKELQGKYIYTDFVSGVVWALSFRGMQVLDNVVLAEGNGFTFVSFGVDESHEFYILGFDGNIYQLKEQSNE